MKKFKIISLFTVIIFILNAQQYRSFTRSLSNPIITKNTGNYDSGDIANPDVFFDAPNNRWAVSYSAYGTTPSDASAKWRLCLAYSPNLYPPWTKDVLNPVFEPISGEGYIACNGSIVYKQGLYYHFYNTGPNGTLVGNFNRLATSTDLHNWTRANGGNPIILPSTGTFDQDGLYDPCVRLLADGETFELYYAAKSGGTNSIGFATSTDGIIWTKKGRLMSLQSWWNTSNFAEPCGYRLDGGMYLTWDAALTANLRNIAGGFTFNNGVDWQYFGFFLLASGGSTNWDRAQVFDSYVINKNDSLFLFYAGGVASGGTQGMSSQIGEAFLKLVKQNK